MARLPVPGSDDNVWGQILNDFLSAIHNPDGTLKANVVSTTNIQNGAITAAKLADTYISITEKGVANGVATLDSGGTVPPSQLPPQGSVPDATTISKGVVQLAGDLSGVATAPTVPALGNKVDKSTVTTKGDLLAATAASTITRLGIGVDGRILTADSTQATGLSWATISPTQLPDATAISKGVVQLTGDFGGTAGSPTVPGLTGKVDKATLTTKGDLLSATGPGAVVRHGVGADNTVLTAASAQPDGITWSNITATMLPDATAVSKGVVQLAGDLAGTAASPTVPSLANKIDKSIVTSKGDILAATASSTVSRLGVGADTFVLTADSTQATGIKWAGVPGVADATTSSKGIVELAGDIGGTATNVQVLSTHLAAPLPINQGGTNSTTQNFVDLTTNQNIAGIKTFTTEVIVPAPVNPTDAVTKSYVDALGSGVSVKASVQEATAAALPVNTYNNGASGVGATLTEAGNGALIVDGVMVATNDRILVKDEVAQTNNGIYVVTDPGSAGTPYILTRSTDLNQSGQVPGAFTFVESGTVNSAAGFVVASTGPFTIGATAIVWTQFSGAGEVNAGTGLSKSGNTLSVVYGATGGTSAQGNDGRITGAIQSSTVTTKGDLLAATAPSTITRVGVGSDGKVLTADSTQASGVNWLAISPSMLPDATTLSKGIVQLAGDLGGTAASPTVPGLAAKANDNAVVHLALTETITGAKTFTTNDVTLTDVNLALSAATGTKIGTATTQKLAFYNATPIVQPSGDVPTALSNLGLVASPTISEADVTNLSTDLSNKVSTSLLGAANGVATLDSSSFLTAVQRPPMVLPYSMNGALFVKVGDIRLYNDSTEAWTIIAVRATVGGSPTGASVIVDIKINGTTIFTTTANRPTIIAGGNTSGKITNMDITNVPVGNYFTVDIAQIGSTFSGSDLSVQIEVR